MAFGINHTCCAMLAATLVWGPATAQAQQDEMRVIRIPRPEIPAVALRPSAQRAVLGLTLGTAGAGDTAGIRVEAVDPDGPAARAGIRAGDVLIAIQGTSLRMAPADAQDPGLRGVVARRLQRALAAAQPGDTVRVDVRTGAAPARLLRVVVMSAAALADANCQRGATGAATGVAAADARAAGRGRARSRVIGVLIGASGTRRDTIGLFVSRVTPNGPAERAGIVEGDRIAAVNGADLRVPAEDIEDPAVGSARTDRFIRAIAEADSGRPVQLRVIRAGQTRDVRVTPELDTASRVLLGQPLDPEFAARIRVEGQRLRDSLDGWRLHLERELPALIERAVPRLEFRMSPPVVRRTRIIV